MHSPSNALQVIRTSRCLRDMCTPSGKVMERAFERLQNGVPTILPTVAKAEAAQVAVRAVQ